MPPLGAHMSIAGGMALAVDRARSVEATALQIFVKSSNQWAARPFAAGEAEAFRRAAREAGLERATLAHASYLINLASPDDALWQKSITALSVEIERCSALGIPFLVVHPGSHMGSGEEAGLARVARALTLALGEEKRGGESPELPGVMVLVEITAGQGHALGATFDQLASILDHTDCGVRLGVCFDTCHALAAGHDFRDAHSYERMFSLFDRVLGLDRLKAFHLNDSKGSLGSRLDRHQHIGKGEVGLEAFRLILNDPRFAAIPMVLETRKGDDLAEDRENLSILRGLVRR